MIDIKGLGFQLSSNTVLDVEKLYIKDGFDYLVLEHNNQKELYVLPNEKIEEYTNRIASKVDFCKNEDDAFQLIINEMCFNKQ